VSGLELGDPRSLERRVNGCGHGDGDVLEGGMPRADFPYYERKKRVALVHVREAEAGEARVQSHPWLYSKTLSQKKKKKAGMEEKGVTWGNLKVGEEKAAPELSGRCDLGTQRVCILTL
jgi:hypothetical protein